MKPNAVTKPFGKSLGFRISYIISKKILCPLIAKMKQEKEENIFQKPVVAALVSTGLSCRPADSSPLSSHISDVQMTSIMTIVEFETMADMETAYSVRIWLVERSRAATTTPATG